MLKNSHAGHRPRTKHSALGQTRSEQTGQGRVDNRRVHVALCHRGGLSMGGELYLIRCVGPSAVSFWDFGDECCWSDRLFCGNFTRINTQSLHRRHPLT